MRHISSRNDSGNMYFATFFALTRSVHGETDCDFEIFCTGDVVSRVNSSLSGNRDESSEVPYHLHKPVVVGCTNIHL